MTTIEMSAALRPYFIIHNEMFPVKKIEFEGEIILRQSFLGRAMTTYELINFAAEQRRAAIKTEGAHNL